MELKNIVTKPTVISSLAWKLMESSGMKAVGLIVQIVLARLLSPDDFGMIAIVLAFINIAQVFVQSGLGTALIQKKDSDSLDFSTIWFTSLVIAVFFYILIFFFSPMIAEFYGDNDLVKIIRVLSLVLFPGAINSIQNAFISKNMLFKKLFRINMVSVLVSSIIGIVTAYLGFGIWSLVIYYLSSSTISSVVMFFAIKWRPKFQFSFERLRSLFSFGGKLLASSLIHTFYVDLRTLVIGRMYSSSDLGFYNRGESVPKTIEGAINGSIQAVMLPTLSSMQNDKRDLKRVVRRSIKTSSFLLFPVMAGLAIVAKTFISLVLGEKWLLAVPFLQLFCISAAFQMLQTANLQAINALGRSDIILKLEMIKKILGLTALAISISYGIYAIAVGFVVSTILELAIHMFSNKKLYNYSATEQLRDILPPLILSFLMGLAIHFVSFLSLLPWQILLIQIPIGILVYVGMAKLFKIESLYYIFTSVKDMIR